MSIRKCNGHFYVEPSLTSRDTRTEFQNPSVPKTYLVGSNHHAEQWYKNEVKNQTILEIYCVKESSYADRILEQKLKNQTVKLLKMTKSINFSTDAFPYSKISIITQFNFDIL